MIVHKRRHRHPRFLPASSTSFTSAKTRVADLPPDEKPLLKRQTQEGQLTGDRTSYLARAARHRARPRQYGDARAAGRGPHLGDLILGDGVNYRTMSFEEIQRIHVAGARGGERSAGSTTVLWL